MNPVLEYSNQCVPDKVRLVSRAMGMDYKFEPDDYDAVFDVNDDFLKNLEPRITIHGLFKLANTGLFDHIYVFADRYTMASYINESGDTIDLFDWFDLMQFSDKYDDNFQ